jgi:para-aminobenzoate synthetase/4-amino-4-deoxychorismate lyase
VAELLRVPLDWDRAPEDVLLAVRDDPVPFALVGAWCGGGAVVGSAPVRVAQPGEDPFALLDEQPRVEGAPEGAVGGGWVGVLGFGLGALVERVPPPPPRPVPAPAARLAFYDHVLHQDADGRWWFEALVTPGRAAALDARLAELRARAPRAAAFATDPWRAVPGPAGHGRAVAAAVERIAHGDLFQANLTLRLESRLHGAAVDLFATAARALRPAHAAFVGGPGGAVASLSPELFLRRRGRAVRSSPIKGTRPADRLAELVAAEKDRAEHVMIVDLVRNDLGRVCVPGTVAVGALATPRPGPGVWHLVSDVDGELAPGVGDAALVRAAFPPGSVTGAPKVAALGVIAELESTGREAYTGAIGIASPLAGLELNVAIRTFEVAGDRIWLGVGGGVVADSEPAAEAAEALTKADPLLTAIGAERAGLRGQSPQSHGGVPVPRRLGPRPVPRPDPAAGVFTTLLVRAGRPVALAAHLDRLGASVAALYGRPLPAGVPASVARAAAAAGPGPARLRVDVTPDGAHRVVTTPLAAPGPVALAPVALPGGLGPHKLADRALWDALEAAVAPAQPLAVDLDGLVLETARASVVARLPGGALVTPPRDGRILPGTTVGALVAAGVVRERPLELAELAGAALFVASATHGVRPARLPAAAGPGRLAATTAA